MRLASTTSFAIFSICSVAYACSCGHTGGCPGLGGKDGPVFLGTVLGVTDIPGAYDTFLASRKARIRVDESFGGISAEVREIDVLTGFGGGDCGIPFRAGERYLVSAFTGKDGFAHAGICGSSRRIDGAANALRILRQKRDGKRVPSLYGQFARYDRDFQDINEMHAPTPLANRLIRVKADSKVYQTQSDAKGLYEFYELPSGHYKFDPDLPPGTIFSVVGSHLPVTTGGCSEQNIEVFPGGSIQGRIFDSSNKPLYQALVYIVPLKANIALKNSRLYAEYQSQEGFFKFIHLPPGRYLTVVNPEDKLNPQFPYRRTFYPGVRDRTSAAIITIRAGEQMKEADIRLGKPFETRHLNVKVTWADGHLIKHPVFVDAKATGNSGAEALTRQRDRNLIIVELTLLPNEAYKIEDHLTCMYTDGPGLTLSSNQLSLYPEDDRRELYLVIPSKACPEVAGRTLLPNQ